MKKGLELILSAIIASQIITCNFPLTKEQERAKKTEAIVSIVKAEHEETKQEYNSNPDRKDNYHWRFQAIDRIYSDQTQKRLICEGNCASAQGTNNAVFYLADDVALIGVKEYNQKLTGEIEKYQYTIEKFTFNPSEDYTTWTREKDYLNKTTCVDPKTGYEIECAKKPKGFFEELFGTTK